MYQLGNCTEVTYFLVTVHRKYDEMKKIIQIPSLVASASLSLVLVAQSASKSSGLVLIISFVACVMLQGARQI